MLLIDKISSIVAVAVGIVQLALPIIKEAIVSVERVCNVVFFWTDFDENVIKKTNEIYQIIYDAFEKFKNLWLAFGKR